MPTRSSHKFNFVLFSLLLLMIGGLSGCTKRTSNTISFQTAPDSAQVQAININKATAHELEALPHLGPVLAKRIVEHRDRYGPFRRSEHLLAIEGISEKRYRELRKFIDIK